MPYDAKLAFSVDQNVTASAASTNELRVHTTGLKPTAVVIEVTAGSGGTLDVDVRHGDTSGNLSKFANSVQFSGPGSDVILVGSDKEYMDLYYNTAGASPNFTVTAYLDVGYLPKKRKAPHN